MIGPLWKDIRPADVATLLNVFMGILAIYMALSGDTALAFHLIFAAVIVDGIDGAVARMGGGGGPLGHTIDALADVVTFVVAPAIVFIAHYGAGTPGLLMAFVFAAAGILRLARFQALPDARHFLGLSTPGGAIVLGSAVLLGTPQQWTPLLIVAVAFMMMSRWPVPKLRGAVGIAGVAIILATLGIFLTDAGPYGLITQLAFIAVYLVAGPSYLKKQAATSIPQGDA